MEPLLLAREYIIKFVKRYEAFILIVLRFFLGVYVFWKIHAIGHINPELAPFLDVSLSFPALMLLGVAFALLPYSLSYVLIIADIAIQYSANLEIAAVIFLFLLCLLLFYARMAAKESVWIILTVLAFHFKVPYLVPLIAGLYFPLTVVIPIIIGVFISQYIPIIQSLTATARTAGLNLAELPGSFEELYVSLLNSLSTTPAWLFYAFVFVMVTIIVHAISRLSIDFSREIAIALGCVFNIFGFFMAVLMAGEDIPIASVLFGTLLCGAIALLARCFDALLDYQRAESVQFEDENNYYYVRMVPKVLMTKRKRVVRRIRPQPEDEE
jgi:hypothetical protein